MIRHRVPKEISFYIPRREYLRVLRQDLYDKYNLELENMSQLAQVWNRHDIRLPCKDIVISDSCMKGFCKRLGYPLKAWHYVAYPKWFFNYMRDLDHIHKRILYWSLPLETRTKRFIFPPNLDLALGMKLFSYTQMISAIEDLISFGLLSKHMGLGYFCYQIPWKRIVRVEDEDCEIYSLDKIGS